MQRRMYFVLISLQVLGKQKDSYVYYFNPVWVTWDVLIPPNYESTCNSYLAICFFCSFPLLSLVWVCCPVVIRSRCQGNIHFWKSNLTDTRGQNGANIMVLILCFANFVSYRNTSDLNWLYIKAWRAILINQLNWHFS